MANDWIKMRVNLATDPTVRHIARKLGVDAFSVVGRLHALWSWADEHSEDGRIQFVDRTDIDHMADIDGFAVALESVGWLSFDGDDAVIPKFDRHNGASAKRRAMEVERKRKEREAQEEAERQKQPSASRSDTVNTDASASCPQNVTLSCGQNQDKSVTREEKRREEKNIILTLGEAAEAAPASNQADDDEQWLSKLEASPAYAGMPVRNEYVKMANWCAVNRKHPTRRRFINWLNRCDRPMTAGNHTHAQPKPARYIPTTLADLDA